MIFKWKDTPSGSFKCNPNLVFSVMTLGFNTMCIYNKVSVIILHCVLASFKKIGTNHTFYLLPLDYEKQYGAGNQPQSLFHSLPL